MTDAMVQKDEKLAAAGNMQQQGNCDEFRFAAGAGALSEVRLPDPISLPMIQYFQQPSRQSARTIG